MRCLVTFEEMLRQQIDKPGRRRLGKRLVQKVLDAKPSARRTKALARLEGHTRQHLLAEGALTAAQANGTKAIDWSSIDWSKFFDGLLKLLMTLLPLILAA